MQAPSQGRRGGKREDAPRSLFQMGLVEIMVFVVANSMFNGQMSPSLLVGTGPLQAELGCRAAEP